MNLKMSWTAIVFGLAGLPPAQARVDPTPPPSGIVVHLFGPDSVMSNVMPAGSAAPAPGVGAASGGTAPAAAYPEPTLGGVLHQMFVTGDPNDPTRPSTGKTGHELAD